MIEPAGADGSRRGTAQAQFRVRLPGFVQNDEVGLGEAIKRATTRAGIRPCGGCSRRAETLNRWVVFSPRTPR
jgi:hypothetical protein